MPKTMLGCKLMSMSEFDPSVFDKETLYRAIVEAQTELISIASADGILSFVNKAYATHFGFKPEEMLGTSLFDYVDEEARDDVRAYLRALCERGGVSNNENQMRAADGTARWVVWTNVVITDPKGHVTYLQSIGRDLTARRQVEQALLASEAFLDRTGRVAGVGGWELDLASSALKWSDQTCRLHEVEPGFSPTMEQAVAFYAPEARAVIQAAVEQTLVTGQGWDLELPLITRAGRKIWARAVGTAQYEQGKMVRLLGAFQDITERKATERALSEQYELIRVTLQSIADGVIATDADGLVQWFNPVSERMTDWASEQARGQPLEQVFHLLTSGNGNQAEKLVADCIAFGSVIALSDKTVLVGRDGTEYGIEGAVAPILDAQGQVVGVVLVFRDVSEQRRLSHEMMRRAKYDGLTGLINRAEFESNIGQLLTQAQQSGSVHALLFIDLDRFKQVNDACGHAAGDVLLQQIAKMLQEAVRAHDAVARLGGDEFAILLEHCVSDRAQQVGQQICDRMEKFRFVHHGKSFRLGSSIGLVQIDGHWPDTAAIVHAADTSCYAAKASGRNRVHVWVDSSQTLKKRQGEGQWGVRLEAALQQGSFILYAQRVSLLQAASGAQRDACSEVLPEVLSYEVLLRMVDIDGSLILPSAFLPAAERLHLATRLDLWVVNQVLALMRMNATALPPVTWVSVNLTAQAVCDRAFLRELKILVQQPGCDAHRLCLEIPEAVVVSHLAEATVLIAEMRALGVRIALDDFGGASTSLNHLKNLQVDCLKIDGHYWHDLGNDALNQIVVRSFCEVARVLGAKTVAKSVENKAALTTAYAMGVDGVQGHSVYYPEPLSDVLGRPIENYSALSSI